jgi:hypothetical protein
LIDSPFLMHSVIYGFTVTSFVLLDNNLSLHNNSLIPLGSL